MTPMRKALELVVHAPGDELPPAPKASLLFHTFAHGPGCPGWGCHPKHKRLTDAELAAELWHSNFTYMATDHGAERAAEAIRSGILHRMATHPHYDDEGLT